MGHLLSIAPIAPIVRIRTENPGSRARPGRRSEDIACPGLTQWSGRQPLEVETGQTNKRRRLRPCALGSQRFSVRARGEEIAAKGPPHSRDPGTTYDALRGDGTVWAWGPGNTGQLGNASHANSLVPARIPGLANISAIASDGATATPSATFRAAVRGERHPTRPTATQLIKMGAPIACPLCGSHTRPAR